MNAPTRALAVSFVVLVVALVLAFVVVPAIRDSDQESPVEEPFSLVYYDGHMHTTRSDGSGSVADIKATALERGLSAVIVTDHCESLTRAEWESLIAETREVSVPGAFLALPGYEITGDEGIFNRGHFLAYNAPDPFVGDDADEFCPEEVWPDPPNPAGTGPMYPENLAKWADYVHSQGGIVVHNHTSGSTQTGYGVDSIEVYNQSHLDDIAGYVKLLGYSDEETLSVARALNNLALYGERDLDTPVAFGNLGIVPLRLAVHQATGQWMGSPEAPLKSWDQILMDYVNGALDRPIFGVADSDAHNTADPDSKVGVAKNGLYVEELTAEGVYEAIKAGRSFATTGPSLTFDVNGEPMGGTAVISAGAATLHLSADSEGHGDLVEIVIWRNGLVWKTIRPGSSAPTSTYEGTLSDEAPETGYYRVEVTSHDASGTYHFAWSNPVFVKVP